MKLAGIWPSDGSTVNLCNLLSRCHSSGINVSKGKEKQCQGVHFISLYKCLPAIKKLFDESLVCFPVAWKTRFKALTPPLYCARCFCFGSWRTSSIWLGHTDRYRQLAHRDIQRLAVSYLTSARTGTGGFGVFRTQLELGVTCRSKQNTNKTQVKRLQVLAPFR